MINMEKKKFVCNCEGICPVCGGRNLNWDTSRSDGEEMGYDYTCRDCGAQGTQYYKLVFSGHVVYCSDTIENTEDVNDYIVPEN